MRNFVVNVLAAIFLFALASSHICSAQAELVGEWQGTLVAGEQNFRIAWHVEKAADGSVTSTFDNLDEGAFGVKIKSLSLKDSDLKLTVDDQVQVKGEAVHNSGSFAGVLSKDGNEVSGTWTQTDPQPGSAELHLTRAQALPAATDSPQILGDWQGTLSAGGAELRLLFHFTAGKDGTLSATLDSVDQGANSIPVNSVTLKGAKLSLGVDAVQGTYEGTVNADATAITGTWSQGTPLELNLTRAVVGAHSTPKPAAPSDIDGTWQGTLDLGSQTLRIVYKIENTSDGLTASMQSPDQAPAWTTAYPMTRDGLSITIPIKANGSTYDGKLSADKGSIEGTFKQAGNSIPLTLKHIKE